MKKVEKIVLPIVSLLLVAAAIVGMVALYRNVDDIFKEEETTSDTLSTQKPSDTSSNTPSDTSSNTPSDTSSTNEPSDTTAPTTTNYYFDEENGTGYRTINGVTYFFKKIVRANNSIRQAAVILNPYSSYDLKIMHSTDTYLWSDSSSSTEGNGISAFLGLNAVDTIYVTYTVINNCSQPMYVLSDLNANVFFDSNFFYVEQTSGIG